MSEQHTPEPFGYFKAEPFGWTDCAETDEGATALYDKAAIRLIQKQRDELMLYKKLADEYGFSVFADLAELQKQRDELLAALEHFATWARCQHRAQSKGCHATFDMMMLRDEIDFAEAAIASVKELK